MLEEFLDGEELSLLALCDGKSAIPMAPAQDYKRIFDGDEGPNTGGMGTYSPVPGIDDARAAEIAELVHQPVVDELRRRGTPFHGVLYAGLMMTAAGPKVLEYNCRFGDPETQAVLPRLRSDLLDLLDRSIRSAGSTRLVRLGRRVGGHRRRRSPAIRSRPRVTSSRARGHRRGSRCCTPGRRRRTARL